MAGKALNIQPIWKSGVLNENPAFMMGESVTSNKAFCHSLCCRP